MSEFRYRDNQGLLLKSILLAMLITAGLFVSILNYVALLFCLLFIITSEEEDILCILCFLVSFAPIFKGNLGGFTFFNIVVLVSMIKGLIISGAKINRFKGIPFILLAFYSVTTGITNGYSALIAFLSYIFMSILLFSRERIDLHKIITFSTLGIIATSLLGLFKSSIPKLDVALKLTTIRLDVGEHYERFAGIENNPNYYSLIISICIAAFVVLFIEKRIKIIDYVYVCALTVFGLLTVSQSFIVSVIVIAIVTFLWMLKNDFRRAPIVLIFVILIASITLLFLQDDTLNTILFRYTRVTEAESAGDATSGRTVLLHYYLQYLTSNLHVLLFGKGIGARGLTVGASHNFYMDILYHLGLCGGIIYLVCIKRIFFSVNKGETTNIPSYRYIPLIIFIIRAMAINLIAREQLIFALLISSLTILDRYNVNDNFEMS